MRLGIKLKITLAFGIVFILMAFFFNFYGYHTIKKIIITADDRYLLARANSLLAKTEIDPVIIPLPDKNSMIRVSYVSTHGRHVLFRSPGLINKINTPAVYGVTDTLGQRVAFVHDTTGDDPAEVMLTVSNAPLNNNLGLLMRLLFVSSILSVFIAGVVSYFLAGLLLLPIQRIISAAKKISTNKLHERIPVNETGDELQELTKTINQMLQRIDEGIQQQQNFFASASHELKTPLAIMKTGLEVHLNSGNLSQDTLQILKSQLHEITRLQKVVQEFLIISQLKEGSMSLHLTDVDVSELVLRTINNLSFMFNQKELIPQVKFDQDSNDFFIKADAEKMRMVLSNLVENCCKYAVKDSVVKFNIKKTGQNLTICFSNETEAENIPTEKLLTAFKRGNVLEPGTGVGLWLCNQIIAAHGGSLSVKSADHVFYTDISLPVTINT